MAHTKPGHDARQATKPPHEQPRPGKDESPGKEDHEEKIHYDGPRREPGGYDNIQGEGFANVDIQNHDDKLADSRKTNSVGHSESHSAPRSGTKTSGTK